MAFAGFNSPPELGNYTAKHRLTPDACAALQDVWSNDERSIGGTS